MQPRHATWPVLAGQLPPVADAFVARQDTVPGLTAGLPSGGTVVLVPAAGLADAGLPGPGGTGKTTLAAALARAYHENALVDLVLWVTATGRDAVVSGYAQALHDAGLPAPGGPEQAAAAFLDWLGRSGRSWLVVFDDLHADAAQADLWPRGAAGRVLVTADRPDAAAQLQGAHEVTVGAFSPREALAYLFAKLNADPDQRSGALDLAASLGYTPVALGQAAAVMAETGLDCGRYLAQLSAGRQAGDPGAMAAAAWSLSAGFADHLPPAGLAQPALAFLSMLAPGGIPGTVVTGEAACAYLAAQAGAAMVDPAQARAAVQNLARAGLVTIDPGSAARTVLVHPAAAAFARHQLAGTGHGQAATAAADALAAAWSGPGVSFAVAQGLRDCTVALREVGGTALWAPECHRALLLAGQSLGSNGMAAAATDYWHRMLGTSQQLLGPGHPQTAAISDLLGAACEADGRPGEAAAVYERLAADREQVLGPDDPGVLAPRLRLARAYRTHGRPDDAVALATQVAADSDRLLGPGHPDSLTAYAELTLAFLAAGQPRDAVAAAQHTLDGREQALGPGHPAALAARGLLADAYQASGRFKDAITLRRGSLGDWEREQGPGHPGTLAARAGLALAYRSAGKLKEAISQYERTLADREQAQGPDHLDTIRARTDLALTYFTARKFPVAIGQYERAVADCERVLGPGHPFTRETRQNLSEAAAGAQAVLGIDLRSPGRA